MTRRAASVWEWLSGAQPVPAADIDPDYVPDDEEVTVGITGKLPEGTTASVSFIPYSAEKSPAGTALLALDIRLFDEEGKPFSTNEKLTVTLGGRAVSEAAGQDGQILVYTYPSSGSSEENWKEHITLYRDLLLQDGEISDEISDDSAEDSPLRYTEDEDGLMLFEEGIYEFEADGMPLSLIVAASFDAEEETLRAAPLLRGNQQEVNVKMVTVYVMSEDLPTGSEFDFTVQIQNPETGTEDPAGTGTEEPSGTNTDGESSETGTEGESSETGTKVEVFTLKIGNDSDNHRVLEVPEGARIEISEEEGEYDTRIGRDDEETKRGNVYIFDPVDADADIFFWNNVRPICKIVKDGKENVFTTLTAASDFVQDEGDPVTEIEMLRDYVVPHDDCLDVPNNKTVTLTTADKELSENYEYPYEGEAADGIAVITRGTDCTEEAMLINQYTFGTLILRKLVLDGNSVEAKSAMVSNSATLQIEDDVTLRNAKSTGYGGAVSSDNGSVTLENCSFESNSALEGGAIWSLDCPIDAENIVFTGNTATRGGALCYKGTKTVALGENVRFTNNQASQDGGAVYASNGTISITSGEVFSDNQASGDGGAVWMGSGTVEVSGGTFTDNHADNGAAVFVQTGTANFSGGTVSGNAAVSGGAVGVDSIRARLYFSGDVKVISNVHQEGEDNKQANVCLSVDSNAVINASDLSADAAVGIYVPGDPDSELFRNRGQAGASFGTFTDGQNISAFVNDRIELKALKEDHTKKLLWGSPVSVEIRYLGSFANDFPAKSRGRWNGTKKYEVGEYYFPANENKMIDIADLFMAYCGSSTAAYGCAFADSQVENIPFSAQVLSIQWNSRDASWDFVRRDGVTVSGNQLVIFFAEPAYLTIENNTNVVEGLGGCDMDSTFLNVLGQDVITGSYGYVVVKDNILCDPRPIEQGDLDLAAGGSVKLLFPGGCGQNYSLRSRFAGENVGLYERIDVSRTGQVVTTLTQPAIQDGFTLSGAMMPGSRDTLSILFGGFRPVCRIVGRDGTEYPFSSLCDAASFAAENPDGALEETGKAEIELLIDYLIPEEDVVVLQSGTHITLTTAPREGGKYNYSGTSRETVPRAVISRDPGNVLPFFSVTDGGAAGVTDLTVRNLVLDGRNLAGSTDGGALKTKNCDVIIQNTLFRNFKANNGGGIYVDFSRPGSLEITGSSFSNCISGSSANRQGGGAVWTCARSLAIRDCSFTSCSAGDQGGALFHRIDNTSTWRKESEAVLERCTFTDCHAKAAGGAELDSYDVTATGCVFTNCQATVRNGGGLNIYIHDNSSSTEQTSTVVTDCVFRNCSAVSQNGGGLRSTSLETIVSGCSFYDCTANYGGGAAVSNQNSAKAEITDCLASGCKAQHSGGGLYCASIKAALVVDKCTVRDNSAVNWGGGIYTTSNLVLRNDTRVTGNRLTAGGAANAAGVYIANGKTLTVGKEPESGAADLLDGTTVTGNTVSGGGASDLRLSETSGKNSVNSVSVLCGLNGEIRVVNAKYKGDQFGLAAFAYPAGLSDLTAVFRSDEGELYGMIDRTDASGTKIIWQGQWVCKITDGSGALLYVDQKGQYPAVFDALDTGTTSAGTTTAFGMLKNTRANLKLYDKNGVKYDGDTFYVKMLAEQYTASKYITTNNNNASWMKVILTTAGRDEEDGYSYRGRAGTVSTIVRGSGVGTGSLLTGKVNLTLTDITLDGGAGNGITSTPNGGLLMVKDGANVTVTIGKNAVLQNYKGTGNGDGGGVYINKGTSLVLDGGTIRNCSARNGAGVYCNGTEFRIENGGSVIACSAAENGGGVCFQAGTMTMSSGSITNCSAKNGGGIYTANKLSLSMRGGSITGCSAVNAGGGIAVGGTSAKLLFSGTPTVMGNTKNGAACNVELNLDTNLVIQSTGGGLQNQAYIGIFVPDGATLYDKHGTEGLPFGQYTGSGTDAIHAFVNDRNGLKGGLVSNGAKNTVYWVRMLSLEVSKTVENEFDEEKSDDEFEFKVTLTPPEGEKAISGTYGGMTFVDNVAIFTLGHDERITAEDLPENYHYTVEERMTDIFDDEEDNQAGRYITTPSSMKKTGTIGENLKNKDAAGKYISRVSFTNTRVVCKITGEDGSLLFIRSSGSNKQPAVFPKLTEAFKKVSEGSLLTRGGSTYSGLYRIEMLVPEHKLDKAVVLEAGRNVVLTTASSEPQNPLDDEDIFNYRSIYSTEDTAVITRGFTGKDDRMFSVNGREGRPGRLSLEDITLDGGSLSEGLTSTANGGIVYAANRGILEIREGATLRNSSTQGSGGAVYAAPGSTVRMEGGLVTGNTSKKAGGGIFLAEGSRLELSGSPDFGGPDAENGNHQDITLTEGKNGGEEYLKPRQDIYIAGYGNETAESLVLTAGSEDGGPLFGETAPVPGSIWVWAEESLDHCRAQKQFAVLGTGLDAPSAEVLMAFRNAVTDELSENGTESWLHGTVHEDEPGFVFWNGNEDGSASGGRKVILRKIGADYVSLEDAVFTIYRGSASEPMKVGEEDDAVTLENLTSTSNGIFYVGLLPYGTYYLHETSAPAGYAGNVWFTLEVTEDEVTWSGPRDMREES